MKLFPAVGGFRFAWSAKRHLAAMALRHPTPRGKSIPRAEGAVIALASALYVALGDLLPGRLVSHHMRLLGVLARHDDADWLVLVDCDRTE
jgi:hypothetical protein